MKKTLLTLLAVLSLASTAVAEDSIAVGVRYGGEIGNNNITTNSEYYEGFADIYLNKLVSVGASISYLKSDLNNGGTISNQESYPVTALFKIHVPIPLVQPYAGLGQAIIFHSNNQSTTGSPVAFAGLDISPLPIPIFLNVEYRHQFNGGNLDFIAGGAGIKF